ncbi:penicillin-binding protein [Salipaludibacillus keqinensis]|uniref:Penicillin-binding protein n=1 Tax=Salipaludibacillus keqinensis TaxID=2045207 RepID=A0A323TJS1_9BACI|nr:serine hydrolase [Salipaludibacillus keqinensis]PYZ95128.1 penicillin-binding protein [Salipaludibacillus keqinensis]
MPKIDSSFFPSKSLSHSSLKENNIDKLEQQFEHEQMESCLIYQDNVLVYTFEKKLKLATQLHKVNSVTKSFLSSLIGIALEKGYLTSLEQPLSDFFSPRESQSSEVNQITLRHLLTMTSGFDPRKWTNVATSENWTETILNEPLKHSPGEKMVYNNSDSHLLSAILQVATRKSTQDFANEYLFQPLGIDDYQWKKSSDHVSIGGYGLYMTPIDAMKYAVLYLQKGIWNDRQILPADWIEEATRPHVSTDKWKQAYGFHWWVSDEKPAFYYAAGRGGKFLFISPEQQLAVVFTANLSNKESLLPYQWFVRYILD